MLNFNRTIISQYAQAPTLTQLISNMDQYIDPRANMAAFYNYVWNVDTAVGFGLDIWGRIVGVSRLLRVPGQDPIVGFDNPSVPKDWVPMSQGRLATGTEAGGGEAVLLPDAAYRTLILTKALSNIVRTTSPAINQLLQNLFPARGRAYVRDLGNMAMQFVFNFALTPVEYAIVAQSGALPHPTGVFYSVVVVPLGVYFGFRTSNPTSAKPFRYAGSTGAFFSRPNA